MADGRRLVTRSPVRVMAKPSPSRSDRRVMEVAPEMSFNEQDMDEKAPVVVFEADAGQNSRLRDALPGVDCRFVEQVLSDQTVAQVGEASVVSVFIRSQVSRTVIESMANVRLIATRSDRKAHV